MKVEAKLEDITVVLRSSNERTVKTCKNIILNEVSNENIFVTEVRPFSEAVKETFRIGIERNKKWTLAVDADLILISGSISVMIENAAKYLSNLYMYQGHILDKFRGGIKQGGPHLYLTENLFIVEKFYEEINNQIRPETYINHSMELLGYKVITDKKIYAFHDFEQYYKDIYRKLYFHGIKHHEWRVYLPVWMKESEKDQDFIFAVRGFIDGYFSGSKTYPTIDYLNDLFEENVVTNYEFHEKDKNERILEFNMDKILLKYNISTTSDLDYFINKIKDETNKKSLLRKLAYLIKS